jgi:hypothetical protein
VFFGLGLRCLEVWRRVWFLASKMTRQALDLAAMWGISAMLAGDLLEVHSSFPVVLMGSFDWW